MTTFYEPFEQINEARLESLIANKTLEGYQLEYKDVRVQPGSIVEEIVSFANTQGGDIFIGLQEADGGLATALEGFEAAKNSDSEILRFSSSARQLIDPPLVNVRYQTIRLSDDRFVVHIRVPRSWIGPHTANSKFMLRTASQKVPARVSEVRHMMSIRDSFLDKYENFLSARIERAIKISSLAPPSVIVHYVPVSAFDLGVDYPVVDMRETLLLSVMGGNGVNLTINVNGPYNRVFDGGYVGHTQIFRNGIIEQVSDFAIRNKNNDKATNQLLLLNTLEGDLRDALNMQVQNYHSIGMNDPFYLFVSLYGVQNVVCSTVGQNEGPAQKIGDKNLSVPEVMIENRDDASLNEAVSKIMKILWNAFGYPERRP